MNAGLASPPLSAVVIVSIAPAENPIMPMRSGSTFASKIYAAGESGMEYQIFLMSFDDGASLVFATGNIVDFPDYPIGYDSRQVVDPR